MTHVHRNNAVQPNAYNEAQHERSGSGLRSHWSWDSAKALLVYNITFLLTSTARASAPTAHQDPPHLYGARPRQRAEQQPPPDFQRAFRNMDSDMSETTCSSPLSGNIISYETLRDSALIGSGMSRLHCTVSFQRISCFPPEPPYESGIPIVMLS